MRTPSLALFKEEMQQRKKGKRWGQKTLSLPLFNADGNAMGCVLTDGMRPARRDDAWLDRTWPRHGPPLSYAGRGKQGATARRRPSAFPSKTWKGPTTGSLPRGDQQASWVDPTA